MLSSLKTIAPLFLAVTTAASTSSLAATPIVTLFLLDTDPQPLVASVLSVSASATTYVVGCPTPINQDSCGYNPPETVRHSGSVYGASLTDPAEQFTMSYECTVFSSSGTSAVCTTSAGGARANFPGETVLTVAASKVAFLPVTVTGGAAKLAGRTGPASLDSAAATASSSTASSTSKSTPTTAAASASASSSAAAAAVSKGRALVIGAGVGGIGIGIAALALAV